MSGNTSEADYLYFFPLRTTAVLALEDDLHCHFYYCSVVNFNEFKKHNILSYFCSFKFFSIQVSNISCDVILEASVF